MVQAQDLMSKMQIGRLSEEEYLLGYDKYNEICIPMIRVAFHEAPVIETCIMNIQEWGEPKNI